MLLIALTGGIASGKSTIARRLAEHGAVRIDADQLSRDAVALGSEGLARIATRFGDHLLLESGELDRAGLAALVFGDVAALADLNDIVHPEVRRLAAKRIEEAAAVDAGSVVVYEIPLLAEVGTAGDLEWDLVVVAEAPIEQRVERMVRLRGMTPEDARARIASQASDAARREIADLVIDTSGSEGDTLAQVDALWERLSARAREASAAAS